MTLEATKVIMMMLMITMTTLMITTDHDYEQNYLDGVNYCGSGSNAGDSDDYDNNLLNYIFTLLELNIFLKALQGTACYQIIYVQMNDVLLNSKCAVAKFVRKSV